MTRRTDDAAKAMSTLKDGLRKSMPPAERREFDSFVESLDAPKLRRCPTCGMPVASIFDHVDTNCEAK